MSHGLEGKCHNAYTNAPTKSYHIMNSLYSCIQDGGGNGGSQKKQKLASLGTSVEEERL